GTRRRSRCRRSGGRGSGGASGGRARRPGCGGLCGRRRRRGRRAGSARARGRGRGGPSRSRARRGVRGPSPAWPELTAGAAPTCTTIRRLSSMSGEGRHGMGQSWFGRAGRAALVGALLAATAGGASARGSAGDPAKGGAATALEIPGSPQAGPIGTSGHFLLAEGYMVVVPTGPAVLPPGGTTIEVQQSFTNTFSLSDSLLPLV